MSAMSSARAAPERVNHPKRTSSMTSRVNLTGALKSAQRDAVRLLIKCDAGAAATTAGGLAGS